MKINLKLVCLSFFTFSLAYCQDLPIPKSILSPTAGNLGLYGDVPMNLFTGNANISVPLYSFNIKNVALDISLNYNSSGIKVNDAPGWVGQNWNLNCGGIITRQVNSFPDELYINNGSATASDYGYYFPQSHQRLNSPNWSSLHYLEDIAVSNQGLYVSNMPIGQNLRDAEPDIFTFNFMGMSGKFFLSEEGIWKVSSSNNLKVEILQTDFLFPLGSLGTVNDTQIKQSKCIGKITITDDNGNRYIFGKDNSVNNIAIEYSKDFISQRTSQWIANSWYLVAVYNHQNLKLYDFEYERSSSFGAYFYNYSRKANYNMYTQSTPGFPSNSCNYTIWAGQGYHGQLVKHIFGTLNSYVSLKKIQTLYNEVVNFNSTFSNSVFYQNSQDVKFYLTDELSYVNANPNGGVSSYFYHLTPYSNITNSTELGNTLINRLKFKQLNSISGVFDVSFEYNTPNYNGEHSMRLNLNKIVLDGLYNKSYEFEYDRFNELPLISSNELDHLGYYNNTIYNLTTTSVSSPNFQTLYYNSRNTNIDKVKIGLLSKIIYPTKGFTEFEFEPHNYTKVVSNDKSSLLNISGVIGGVRIKNIKNHDLNGNINIKEYKYVKNYNLNNNSSVGSGVLNNLPIYFWNNWTTNATTTGSSMTENLFSTNPILQLSNFSGSPITYDEVVEISNNNGYKIYKYNNHNDFMDEANVISFDTQVSPYGRINDKSIYRGSTKEISFFDQNNNCLKKIENIYSNNQGNIKFVKGTNVSTRGCPNQGWGVITGSAYKIYYFDYDLIESKTTNYLSNGIIEDVNSFSYQYYPNLQNSDGDRFILSSCANGGCIEYKYAHHLPDEANVQLVQKRIFEPLEIITLKNNTILGRKKIKYNNVPVFGSNNFVLAPQEFYEAKSNDSYELKKSIDYYSFKNNVLLHHNSFGIYTLLSYGYFGKYLIAEINASNFDNIQLYKSYDLELQNYSLTSSSTSNINQLFTTTIHNQILNKLLIYRNYFSDYFVKTYSYNKYGLYTVTDEKNVNLKFEYDNDGKLKEQWFFNRNNSTYELLSRNVYNYKN